MSDVDKLREGSVGFRLRFLLRDSVIYGSAAVFSRMVHIFTVPIVSRAFAVDEFAVIDGVKVVFEIALCLLGLGLTQSVARYIFKYDDEATKKQIVSQAIVVDVVVALAGSALLFVAAEPMLARILEKQPPAGAVSAFRIAIATLPFSVFLTFAEMLLKWNFARKRFLVLTIGSTVTTVALTLALVVGLDSGIDGVFLGQLISVSAFALLGVAFCVPFLARPLGLGFVRRLLGFGWPLMLNAVLESLLPSVDRYLLLRFIGLDAVGIYGMGSRFGRLMQLPIGGFNIAWGPFAYSVHRQDDAERTYRKVLLYQSVVLVVGAVLFIALAEPALILFASEKYRRSLEVVTPIVFAYVFQAFGEVTGLGIALSRRTVYYTVSYAVQLLVSCVTTWLLVPRMGLLGAAHGLLAGKVALTASLSYFARRVHPIRFDWRMPIAVYLAGFGVAILIWKVHFDEWSARALWGISWAAGFSVLVWLVAVPRADRAALVERARSWGARA